MATTTTPTGYPLSTARIICFAIDVILILAAIISFVFAERKSIGFLFLFLEMYFVYKTLFEIHQTQKGVIFRMGDFTGTIDAGWHRSLPAFWEIRIELLVVQELVIRGVEMYLKKGTLITIQKVTVFFKITDFYKYVMIEKPLSRLYDESLAKIKGIIGQMTFTGEGSSSKTRSIVKEQNYIEEAVRVALHHEMDPHGIEITAIALVDVEENIVSQAAKIRTIGDATAYAEGKIADALAGPLKDNYPAAVARVGESLSKVLAEILANVLSGSKKGGGKK